MRAFRFACIAWLFAAGAQAQYPVRPVHVVVPFPAGGTVDATGRAIGAKLAEIWKQPVIIENRVGAGGNIGADTVAKSAPDGHTLLMTIQALAISASLYRKLPFDPLKDLVPIVQLTSSLQALVVGAKLPVKSVQDLIAYAKANPGKLDFGTSGLGAPNHLYAELLKDRSGIDMVHVPYKGDAPQTTALLAGEVAMAFMPPFPIASHLRSGKLRALAVTSARRSELMPDVPTMQEAGIADFEFTGWIGLFAPAGTAQAVIDKVNADARRVVQMPDIVTRLRESGNEFFGGSTQEQFAARYRTDIAKFGRIIKTANIPQAE
jgi:tripartite-type tricarboxylate transporter receptor subunit TctC